jgi:hypothetical protein
MLINRNTTTIVSDTQISISLILNFNARGVACHRFVHRVVDNFCKQVVKRLFVSSTDIHARAAAHRFEAFEHGNIIGRVAVLTL